MRALRVAMVSAVVGAAAFVAPGSASAQAPEPVKEAFITAGNAADEAERETIDFACWVVFGAEPGTCAS